MVAEMSGRVSPGAMGFGSVTSRRSRREGALDLVFLAPISVVLGAFLLYPLGYGIVLSLHDFWRIATLPGRTR